MDVHVILQRADGHVLVMERQNTGFADGLVGLPSGHLDPGETVLDAAAREAEEEIGVVIEPADLTFVHVGHRSPTGYREPRLGFFFTATRWQGEPENREPDKCARIWWADPDALPAETIDYIADTITGLRDRNGNCAFSVYGDWNS